MADTFTTNLNLTKPAVGADASIWGGLLNSNFDTIDGAVGSLSTTLSSVKSSALSLTNGTLIVPAISVTSGSSIGTTMVASSYQIDANFALSVVSTTIPTIALGSNTALSYNRQTGVLTAAINGVSALSVASNGVSLNVPLTLSANPTANLQAATKQYVDAGLATKFATSGGGVSGDITCYRSNAQGTGAIYLGTGGAGLIYDGTNFNLTSSGGLFSNGQLVWTNVSLPSAGLGFLNNTQNWIGNNFFFGTLSAVRSTSAAVVCNNQSSGGIVSMMQGSDSTTYFGDSDGTGISTNWRFNANANGNLTARGAVSGLSDERLKDNVATIDNALDKVKALRGVTYTRNDQTNTGQQIGLIAQDVQAVVPEAVVDPGNGGYLSVAYGNMVGLLVEAIKELSAELDALKAGG